MARQCELCPTSIPSTARADARTCSTRCRVAAHRAQVSALPPAELRALPRWVRWSSRKVPLTTWGVAASSTDGGTWAGWGEASRSTVGVGVGFVLDGDGVVCLDLDGVLEGGVLVPWARAVVEAAGSTWVEVSPSGRGLHVWGRGVLPRGGRFTVPGGQLEAYQDGRYITVTGRRWRRAPGRLGDLGQALVLLG